MNDVASLLNDYTPLLKRLSNNPLKQFKGQKPVYLHLTSYEKEELYAEFQVKFLELAASFDEERGTPFSSYIGSHLGWYAHRLGEKLFDEKKYLYPIDDMDSIEYIEPEESIGDELPEELLEVIESLSPRQNEVINMLYIQNMTVKSIAKELGVTEEAIYRHRRLGVENMKKKMQKYPSFY